MEFDCRASGAPIFVPKWRYTLNDTAYSDNIKVTEIICALSFPRDMGKMLAIQEEVFRVPANVGFYQVSAMFYLVLI